MRLSISIKLTLFFMLTSISVYAQKQLSGVIKMAGQAVSDVTVFTSFDKSAPSDFGGVYALNLSGCGKCLPGQRIKIYTWHIEHGSMEHECIISADYKFDVIITNNPSKMFITGAVQNSTNNDPLEGVEVKIMSGDIDMDPVMTNSFGQFRIPVNKYQLERTNAVRIQVRDPRGQFRPLRSDPELLDINNFNIIKMQFRNTSKILVNSFASSNICFSQGNMVTIEATGQIRVGTFVGSSDPDGRVSGVMGMTLESYNIVSNFNHAALMYRFRGETAWRVAGKRKRFVASKDGCLEFEVNDNSKGDNYGQYDVEVTVEAN
jgi:hypothetical protein